MSKTPRHDEDQRGRATASTKKKNEASNKSVQGQRQNTHRSAFDVLHYMKEHAGRVVVNTKWYKFNTFTDASDGMEFQ